MNKKIDFIPGKLFKLKEPVGDNTKVYMFIKKCFDDEHDGWTLYFWDSIKIHKINYTTDSAFGKEMEEWIKPLS